MRAVIQRVSSASVTVEGEIVGAIGRGLLVLIGKEEADSVEDIEWLAQKMVADVIAAAILLAAALLFGRAARH